MADQIVQTLVLDGTQMLQAVAELKEGLREIAKLSGATEAQIQDAFNKGAVNAQKYDKALDQAVKSQQELLAATKQTAVASTELDKAAQKADNLGDELEQAAKAAKGVGDETQKAGKRASEGIDGVQKGASKLVSFLKGAGQALVAFFAVDKIIAFGQAVFQATAQMQKFQVQLKVALGSESEAKQAFATIQEFAKRTPFEVNELTDAFIRFANRGIKLTTQELTKIGDLASSQGKGFIQLTEAILDAGTLEFERLKEFGIKARQVGDQVVLTFKNQTVTVQKNEEAIREAIIAMGAWTGVAGGMEEQAKTLGGQASNLTDAWNQLLQSIGEGTKGVFSTAISIISDGINAIKGFVDQLNIIQEFNLDEDVSLLDKFLTPFTGNKVEAAAQNIAGIRKSLSANFDLAVKEISEKGLKGYEITKKSLEDLVLNPALSAARVRGIKGEAEAIQKEFDKFLGGANAAATKDAEQRVKKLEDKAKQDEEKKKADAKKAEADRQKALQQRVQAAREELSLEKELAQARIELLSAGQQKELALEQERNRAQRAEFAIRLLTVKEGSEQYNAIRQLQELEEQKHGENMAAIREKYAQEQIQLAQETQQRLFEATASARELELAQVDQQAKAQLEATRKQYKGNQAALLAISATIIEEQNKKTQEINDKYAAQELTEQEQRDTLLAELSIQNEEARELAVLQIRKKYAQERLDLLLASGKAENDVAVLEAKKLIKGLDEAISQASSQTGGGGLRGLIKNQIFGELSQSEFAEVEKAFQGAVDNVFSALQAGIQAQINERQQAVDVLNEQIDEVEAALDREYRLQEQGYANNAALREKELQDLKAKREQAIKFQQEAQKKQANIQKAQIALDTISQVSDLITSSAQIFKAMSKVPVVGIPIAIALIGTMFGAFAAAKVNAFKLAGTQKFAEGGEAGGRSHSQGGNKYISMDGQDIMEIERGEYIINKRATRKHRELVEAINNDELSSWSFADLQRFVDPTGTRMRAEVRREVSEATGSTTSAPRSSGHLGSIDKNIQAMLELQKKGEQIIDMGEYILIKKGSITRKIKK